MHDDCLYPLITIKFSSSTSGAIGTVVPDANDYVYLKGVVIEQRDLDLPCTVRKLLNWLSND